VLGFFKKTFTSVKKTFESTFNQPSKRALSRPRSKMATPLVDVRLESPKHKRTTRSITFHVSNEAPSLLQMLLGTAGAKPGALKKDASINLSLEAEEDESPQTKMKLGSNVQRVSLAGKQHTKLNNSGYFVFNEDDMK